MGLRNYRVLHNSIEFVPYRDEVYFCNLRRVSPDAIKFVAFSDEKENLQNDFTRKHRTIVKQNGI